MNKKTIFACEYCGHVYMLPVMMRDIEHMEDPDMRNGNASRNLRESYGRSGKKAEKGER